MSLQPYPKTAQIRPRPKPMKVLVLGLPRTGTVSLYMALRNLGFNPYHFIELIRNKDNGHFQLWRHAVQNKYFNGGEPFAGEAFDQMLWDYDAVLDSPACFFVEELIAAYPEAKVVLTTRTPESWLKSMQNTLLEVITWRSWTLLAFLDGDYSAPYWKLFNSIMRVFSPEHPVSQHAYQPPVPGLLQYFDDHHSKVRQAVPKERLLEYHPSHGWEPLCSFLGVPVPEGEFPRENDSKSFVRIHRQIYWGRWLCVARNMAATVGVGSLVAMAAWWWRR